MYFKILFSLIKLKISIDFLSTVCYNIRVMKMNYNYVASEGYLK